MFESQGDGVKVVRGFSMLLNRQFIIMSQRAHNKPRLCLAFRRGARCKDCRGMPVAKGYSGESFGEYECTQNLRVVLKTVLPCLLSGITSEKSGLSGGKLCQFFFLHFIHPTKIKATYLKIALHFEDFYKRF